MDNLLTSMSSSNDGRELKREVDQLTRQLNRIRLEQEMLEKKLALVQIDLNSTRALTTNGVQVTGHHTKHTSRSQRS